MLEIKVKDRKIETIVEGTKFEVIAEISIVVESLINTAAQAAGKGMTFEEAKKMLFDGASKAHEVKMKDESKD